MYYLIFILLFIDKLVSISGTKEVLNLPAGAECAYGKYNGTCTEYYACFAIYGDYRDKDYAAMPNCNLDGDSPVVCCPDCEVVDNIRTAEYFDDIGIRYKKGTMAHDKCIEYLSALYKHKTGPRDPVNHSNWKEKVKCVSDIAKIPRPTLAGGRNAKRDDHPHMALLGYGADLESVEWSCGGSVISEKFVLTAAHCVSESRFGNVTYVAVGILKRSDPSEVWQHHKVKRIIPYPEYNSSFVYHDIALLEIEGEFNFSKTVQPACLDTDDMISTREVEAIGWGELGHRKGLADTLQVVNLEEFSTEECVDQYPRGERNRLINGFDDVIQMCYGSHNDSKDTCKGDSGGPLQRLINKHHQYEVIGVTSSGSKCGIKGGAGLYTRVEPYIKWIEDIVWPLVIDPDALKFFDNL
ncbi:hypothetical protein K1T71_014683 [Dendrolimus kikuchii]|uniref:Uncharacterized protein n=1 Tax=Dendrolimus kikuchii TaxID=765133 RepID=A0ACC1CF55_9NEOP|nr:hypothetical protein K1T71_014683 [Dendrolimus kikuchii]